MHGDGEFHSFGRCLFGELKIHLSRFVPLMKNTSVGASANNQRSKLPPCLENFLYAIPHRVSHTHPGGRVELRAP